MDELKRNHVAQETATSNCVTIHKVERAFSVIFFAEAREELDNFKLVDTDILYINNIFYI